MTATTSSLQFPYAGSRAELAQAKSLSRVGMVRTARASIESVLTVLRIPVVETLDPSPLQETLVVALLDELLLLLVPKGFYVTRPISSRCRCGCDDAASC